MPVDIKKQTLRALAICGALFVPGLVIAQVTFNPGAQLRAQDLEALKPKVFRVMENQSVGGSGTADRVSQSFRSRGGTLIVMVSATGFALTASSRLGIDVLLSGSNTPIGSLIGFSNEAASHKALAPVTIVVPTSQAIDYTITLRNAATTRANVDDFASVTVIEIPR